MKYKVLLFLIACSAVAAYGQKLDTMKVSLRDVVELAQATSPGYEIAKTSLSNNYWIYRSFLADLKPRIAFTGASNLNRSIDNVLQNNGTEKFIERSLLTNRIGLNLQQRVPLTGATVFFGADFRRIDILSGTFGQDKTAFLSSPISIGIIQPIFGFNQLKWNKEIQPLRYEESQKRYSEDLENLGWTGANLFFDVLIAQINLEAARKNKTDADTLLGISRGRFEVGRIAETELLQIELSSMNANADLAQNTLELQTSSEFLRNFLGIEQAVFFQLTAPSQIPIFRVDPEGALNYARQNRRETQSFKRRILEVERDATEARAETSPTIELFGNFGLTQTGSTFSESINNPLDQEVVQLSLNIPIADWGKNRARREIAKSQLELERLQVAQDSINFEREILVKVQQFDLVRNQVDLALKAYEIAQKRLDITRRRYLIGNILITDLNLALREETDARRSYVTALRNYWLAHYDLRRLTLYDFENNRSLVK